MKRLVSLVAVLVCALATTVAPAHAAGDDAVVKAQERLNALHCNAGPADGVAGQWTRSAVIRFQSRIWIAQTGKLDKRTQKRLFSKGAPRCDVRPVPSKSGKGRRIVISQQQNWVWLVSRNGGILAQGGMVDNPGVLSRGAHRSGSYCGRAARIKLNQAESGTVWLDKFVRFAPCGIGFHRVPRYKSSGDQIHADWILGTNLAESHGCIRLSRSLSDKVWSFTTRRTPVRVV